MLKYLDNIERFKRKEILKLLLTDSGSKMKD